MLPRFLLVGLLLLTMILNPTPIIPTTPIGKVECTLVRLILLYTNIIFNMHCRYVYIVLPTILIIASLSILPSFYYYLHFLTNKFLFFQLCLSGIRCDLFQKFYRIEILSFVIVQRCSLVSEVYNVILLFIFLCFISLIIDGSV